MNDYRTSTPTQPTRSQSNYGLTVNMVRRASVGRALHEAAWVSQGAEDGVTGLYWNVFDAWYRQVKSARKLHLPVVIASPGLELDLTRTH